MFVASYPKEIVNTEYVYIPEIVKEEHTTAQDQQDPMQLVSYTTILKELAALTNLNQSQTTP